MAWVKKNFKLVTCRLVRYLSSSYWHTLSKQHWVSKHRPIILHSEALCKAYIASVKHRRTFLSIWKLTWTFSCWTYWLTRYLVFISAHLLTLLSVADHPLSAAFGWKFTQNAWHIYSGALIYTNFVSTFFRKSNSRLMINNGCGHSLCLHTHWQRPISIPYSDLDNNLLPSPLSMQTTERCDRQSLKRS